ncbi:MAG: FtsX-like permease family protein [Candidatus Hydrogenedentes bacterium]|nr:FtsX-like permease family protein [Candidatus Hydrogenedentota bacterium]
MQRQTKLPLRRVIKISWKNIRVRWWRSMLVTCGIVLALAFLTYVLYSDALLRYAVERGSPALREVLRESGMLSIAESADSRIQTRWMVGLALLISFVGILNAMVMSVTERFREIGTMKCLGALDSLIIKLYLIESMFQGLGGTLIGILFGLALGLFEGLGIYGSETFGLVPLLVLIKIVTTCLLAGVLLSVGGALYPAWVAARMQPVDAMRQEV